MGRRRVGKGTDPKCDPRPRPAREPLTDWTRGVALAVGWSSRRVDWPADEWWSRRGITRTCFVTYNGSSGQPMSRFFFDRTADFFKARPSEELFDECARLRLPPLMIKNALAPLGLRELEAGGKRLVVHPGSGGRAKRWPLPNFLEVVRRATARGVAGVLATGEAEEDLEPSLRDVTLPKGWSRLSRLPTDTLAGLLASSTHYIGNDSGPTHLAAACGARVLAFFRDENLPAWRPFGRSRVLSASSPDRIPLAIVLPAVDDFLAS
jgi:ADP-heptose:LPS heptosyltransferase